MAIDWKKEWILTRKVWWWYMKLGFISIPFGIIYGYTRLALGHESKLALVVVLACAIVTNHLIQGLPPDV